MNEPSFKISLSFLAKLKVLLFRLAAVGIIIFSVYKFEQNTRLFSILIVAAVCLILFSGLKELYVYQDKIIVSHKSLIPIPFLNKVYLLNDIKEFVLDVPNRVAELVITKQDPLTVNYKLIILFKNKPAVKISLETNREDLEEKVKILNEIVTV